MMVIREHTCKMIVFVASDENTPFDDDAHTSQEGMGTCRISRYIHGVSPTYT